MVNEKTLKLIEKFEGLRLKAYQDSVGVWTIGYGHTHGVHAGQEISISEAEAFLRQDISDAENAVKRLVKVPLNDDQFGALVSFTYNIGQGNLAKSTLLKKLNSGDYASVPDEMQKWKKAGGRTLPGLVLRRKAEGELFMSQATTTPEVHETPVTEQPQVKQYTFIELFISFIKMLFGKN